MYRLSPPKTTGFQSRLRIVGTVVGASLGASFLMWLGAWATSYAPDIAISLPPNPTNAALQADIVTPATSPSHTEIAVTDHSDLPTAVSNGQGPMVAHRTVVHPIQSGESFGGLLERYGVTQSGQVIAATQKHFNMAHFKAGKAIRFEFSGSTPVSYTHLTLPTIE